MTKNTKTHIYCYDDHRSFSDDVRKKFTDLSRYTVVSYPTREELLSILQSEREFRFCKVVLLGLHDSAEQIEMINHLSIEIRKIDPRTGLIILGPSDKMEIIRKTVKFNVDAYVPKNANSILRIHNTVKKIISEHSLETFRKKMNVSIYVFLAFLVLSAAIFIISFLKYPQYF